MSKSTLRSKFAIAQWPEPAELCLVEVARGSQLILGVRVLTPWLVTNAELDEGLTQLRAR